MHPEFTEVVKCLTGLKDEIPEAEEDAKAYKEAMNIACAMANRRELLEDIKLTFKDRKIPRHKKVNEDKTKNTRSKDKK